MMDLHELTKKAFEHGELLARHEGDIKTLFNNQKDIKSLAESTQDLALSVKELAGRMSEVDERLELIESEKRQKGFALWQIIMSALVGGVITYAITAIL